MSRYDPTECHQSFNTQNGLFYSNADNMNYAAADWSYDPPFTEYATNNMWAAPMLQEQYTSQYGTLSVFLTISCTQSA